MEKEKLDEFLRELLQYYPRILEESKLKSDWKVPSITSLAQAIQLISQKEMYLIPEDFFFSETGDFTLKWKTQNNSGKQFWLTFFDNKDISYSEVVFGEVTKEKFVIYEDEISYFNNLKIVETEMLNFLEGSTGIFAFASTSLNI